MSTESFIKKSTENFIKKIEKNSPKDNFYLYKENKAAR